MKDSESVTFAGASLDRAAHLRDDATALLAMSADPAARAMLHWRGKILMHTDGETALVWLPLDAPVLGEAKLPPIFLGRLDQTPCFAHDISDWSDPQADTDEMRRFLDQSGNQHPMLPDGQVFLDLRANMAILSPADAGNAATAKGIFGWHEIHRFCARCGAPSDVALAGWRRSCPACGAHHFPRTDPVVIMLITHGNKTLLGRSPGWPEGMYSTLAGFMEPGESIEAAVRREVWEEAHIPVGRVRYMSSQPWPFPASLMIGCHGEALDDAITLDPVELEDAIWVSREHVMAAMDGSNPDMRPARKGSIARFLIDAWLADRLN